jgi:glyoxylase I family protein
MDHVCLMLSPFDDDALCRHLAAHNVKIETEAVHGGSRGQRRSFYILDPFGNKLELKGPPFIRTGSERVQSPGNPDFPANPPELRFPLSP